MSGHPRYRPRGWLHAGTDTGGGGAKGRVSDGAEEKPEQKEQRERRMDGPQE